MPKNNDNEVNYNEFSYKNYSWKQDGRFVKQAPTKTTYKAKKVRQHKFDRQSGFVALTIVVCFLITVLLADLLGGGGLLTLMGKSFGSDGKEQVYYALAVDTYDNESYASMTADELRQLGGAGYVIKESNKYYLIASVYGNERDAKTVLKRMQSKNSMLYEIKFTEPNLKWCKNENEGKLQEILSYAEKTYSDLYAISVAMDNQELSEYQARAEIEALYNKINLLKNDFDALNEKPSVKLTKIRAELVATLAMIDNLLNYNLPRYNLVSDIRFTYTAVLLGYRNLLGNI